MAIGLRRQGIGCTVVERHAGTLGFPKGRGISVRSMEIFRCWGFASEIERAGLGREDSLHIFFGSSLLAADFRLIPAFGPPSTPFSPTERLMCDQMAMEAVLVDRARSAGVDLRFSTTLLRFDSDEAGVDAQLANTRTGEESSIRAAWLVAADGARSGVRSALGIERSGSGRHGSAVSIYLRAPLRELMRGRTAAGYSLSDTPGATVLVVDNDERWLIIRNYDPEIEPVELFTPAWALELARRAVGDPTIPIEILGIKCWESAALVADRFGVGRVFLVGDAAHVTTPVGGLGMNDGWAAPALLDSYEPERRPVAVASAEASRGAARPPAATFGVVLGAAYESAAIVPDGSPAPIVDDAVNDYVPTGRPGHRAPHVWLDRAHTKSTLDLFGDGFAVLTDDLGRPRADDATGGLRRPVIPVRVVAPDDDAWKPVYGVRPGGAVLVRPDGHVAWRSGSSFEFASELRAALLQACGHGTIT
jgi:2-polyprenyl-6-methoxyphenol hydroxylase-like FAD-dependent oxidoreductase